MNKRWWMFFDLLTSSSGNTSGSINTSDSVESFQNVTTKTVVADRDMVVNAIVRLWSGTSATFVLNGNTLATGSVSAAYGNYKQLVVSMLKGDELLISFSRSTNGTNVIEKKFL